MANVTGFLPGLTRRAIELRSELRLVLPETLAATTGSFYVALGIGSGEFHLPLFNDAITGAYPDLKFYTAMGDELPEFQELLLLYYFATADGFPLTSNFVSFADLPGGRIYSQAFQGYSGNEIVKVCGDNITGFRKSCELMGGQPQPIADAAFNFSVLPMVTIQVVYWLGDDEFPSACKILFDAAATHYLPIDGCAIIGSNLARQLIKQYLKVK